MEKQLIQFSFWLVLILLSTPVTFSLRYMLTLEKMSKFLKNRYYDTFFKALGYDLTAQNVNKNKYRFDMLRFVAKDKTIQDNEYSALKDTINKQFRMLHIAIICSMTLAWIYTCGAIYFLRDSYSSAERNFPVVLWGGLIYLVIIISFSLRSLYRMRKSQITSK